MKTCSSLAGGSASISLRRLRGPEAGLRGLLVREDVVDGLPDSRDLLGVLVRDLDPELVLELHDQLDQVERIGIEVLLERSLVGDLVFVDAELLDEYALDAARLPLLSTLPCHLFVVVGAEAAADHTASAFWRQPGVEPAADVVLDTPSGGSTDRVRDRARGGVAVGDHDEAADTEQIGAAVGVGVEPAAQAPRRGADQEAAELAGRRARDLVAARPWITVRIVPSSVFSATLPVNPSVTTTSARFRKQVAALGVSP